MRGRPPYYTLCALLLVTLCACDGDLSATGGFTLPPAPEGVITPEGTPPTPETPEDPRTEEPRPMLPDAAGVRAPMRRLTPFQYRNAIRDLFGGRVEAGVFDEIDTNRSVTGYTTEAVANVSTERGVDQIFKAAEAAALQAVDVMPELLPCAATTADAACLTSFFDDFGQRVFRRPVTNEERIALVGVFDAASAEGFTFSESVALVLEAMLQMPAFLYIIERGRTGEADAQGRIALTDHELATRLSFLFLDSIPDAELLRAAQAGELQDGENLRAQARRLLYEHPNSTLASRFIREWLHLDPALEKDAAQFPEHDARAPSYRAELERTFLGMLRSGGTLDELLALREAEVDQAMADFYGIEGFTPGPQGWARVALPERHQGLLLRPYFLASHASTTSSSHVKRGYTVLKQLLCAPTGSPPMDFMSKVPPYPEQATSRQESEILRGEAECGFCHTMIDNIGLSFEAYDATGAWRERAPAAEGSQELDVSGEVVALGTLTDKDIAGRAFEGPEGLTQLLVESTSVEACVPRHWFRYALSQLERTSADQDTIDQMTRAHLKAGGSLEALFLSITQTDAFRVRLVTER